MTKDQIILALMFILISLNGAYAQSMENMSPFEGFPEETDLGEFLCKLTWWRGLPPCLKESVFSSGYSYFPTRQKARIVVDSYAMDGLYSRELLIAYFGSLSTGTYRPVPSVTPGSYWDSAYFALVKLDHRVQAKKMMMDIVMDQGWAKGRFPDERYKALWVLADERVLTLKEYKPLVEFLDQELQKSDVDMNWVNALVHSLSSYREWNEELLPRFRKVLDAGKPGTFNTVLKAFLDFDVPDDAEYILSKVLNAQITDINDMKLFIRAAYVLDDELALIKLKEFAAKSIENPDLKGYIENTLQRLEWYGNWEIMDSQDTWDAGLNGEKIMLKMNHSLDETTDIANFSMVMQINDPEELKPIGFDESYDSNNVTYEITPNELAFNIYNPVTRKTYTKRFIIEAGTGMNEGKFKLKFPVDGEVDKKGQSKYGFIEIEKIS